MIIGLGHKKQVGKDTVASLVQDMASVRFHRKSFAAPLKSICSQLYGIDESIFNADGEVKEDLTYGTLGMAPRQILQRTGAALRSIHPDVFIAAMCLDEVQEKGINLIIPDVRFPNEALAIKEAGGILMQVQRRSERTGDTEISETALDSYANWDYIIFNNGTLDELKQDVLKFMLYHCISVAPLTSME